MDYEPKPAPDDRSGEMDWSKIRPKYVPREQSSNGTKPKRQDTGWRVTRPRIVAGLILAIMLIVGLGLLRDDGAPVENNLSLTQLAALHRDLEADGTAEITIADGAPVGGVGIFDYPEGAAVRLEISSDEGGDVSVDGLGVRQRLEPGGTTLIEVDDVPAGSYDVVKEPAGEVLARLSVEP